MRKSEKSQPVTNTLSSTKDPITPLFFVHLVVNQKGKGKLKKVHPSERNKKLRKLKYKCQKICLPTAVSLKKVKK